MDIKTSVENHLFEQLNRLVEVRPGGPIGDYATWKVHGLGLPFSLIFAQAGHHNPSAGTLSKIITQAQLMLNTPIAYCAEWLSAVERDRLIHRHVPFILPDRQLYLPFLGCSLREEGSYHIHKWLGKPAQRLLLSALKGNFRGPLTDLTTIRLAECSRATCFRVFNELEYFGLLRRNNGRCYLVDDLAEALADAQPRLARSPIQQTLLDEIQRQLSRKTPQH